MTPSTSSRTGSHARKGTPRKMQSIKRGANDGAYAAVTGSLHKKRTQASAKEAPCFREEACACRILDG
jgi:hypothetical protein